MKTKISIATFLVVTVLFLAGCQSSALSAPMPIRQETPAAITAQDAQKVALDNAGFTADAVTNLQVTRDTDDGRLQYEVEFRQGSYEYSYEINAKTGKIIEWDKDFDD